MRTWKKQQNKPRVCGIVLYCVKVEEGMFINYVIQIGEGRDFIPAHKE
jgi:hypothetical protein